MMFSPTNQQISFLIDFNSMNCDYSVQDFLTDFVFFFDFVFPLNNFFIFFKIE